MKNLYLVLILIILITSFESCEKEEDPNDLSNKIEFTDFIASDVNFKTAQISSKIPDNQGLKIEQFGHCWSLESNPDINDSISVFLEYSTNAFVSELNGLKHNSTYYIRAYFKFGDIISYSEEITFKTLEIKLPTLTTKGISNLRAKTVDSGGEVESNNGGEVLARGVCWSKSNNPTIADSVTVDSLGIGIFKSSIKNLEVNTTYYLRAYATNEVGVGYGSEFSFTTKDGIPNIITTEITNLTALTAQSGGSINDDGGLYLLEEGVCWNIIGTPTLNDSIITSGTGIGTYQINLENLQINTTYYLRAYATNELGVNYGNEIIFKTKDGIPDITTADINNLTAISGQSGININNDGGLGIIESGVCWNTTGIPNLEDDFLTGGIEIGNYQINLENLQVNTTYFVRAYVINEIGIFYGSVINFTTKDGILDILTNNISEITSTTAIGGGKILDDEGLEILEKGICWNTTGNPVTSDQKTINGSDDAIFLSSIDGLNISTTYYVRAYAINDLGINYGNDISFTTSDGLPIINTIELSEITLTSLKSGGEIITDDGSAITEKGLCWNLTGAPTVIDTKRNEGYGSVNFTSYLENLTEGKTYYIRAYAINSIGIAYGKEISISLTDEFVSIQDYDGNWYNPVKIGSQIWLNENLKTTHYANGEEIPNGSEITTIDISDKYWMIPTYSEGDEAYKDTYGLLYTWAAATNSSSASATTPSGVQGVCPDGWYVPSNNEWSILANYLGGGLDAGGKLKEVGIEHWDEPNLGATNESGFTALPAGFVYSSGSYSPIGNAALFWTSNSVNVNNNDAVKRECNSCYTTFHYSGIAKTSGVSVRCIKKMNKFSNGNLLKN